MERNRVTDYSIVVVENLWADKKWSQVLSAWKYELVFLAVHHFITCKRTKKLPFIQLKGVVINMACRDV